MPVPAHPLLDNYPVFTPDLDNFDHVECKYCDPDVFFKYKSHSFLNILMLNVRSLRKNFSLLLAYFSYVFIYFSFILLTETWLDPDFTDNFDLPGFYKFDLCRNNYGGGVRLFIRDGIQASLLSDFTFINDFIEILTLECSITGVKYVISLVYHPPSSCHVTNNMFVDSLLTLLRQLQTKGLPIIVGGDMNLNLLNPYNFGYINSFINGMFELGLVPAINIPTKVNADNVVTKYSIIDQFWVTSTLNIPNACVIPLDLTDHFPAGLTINLHSTRVIPTTGCQKRVLTHHGKNAFRLFLTNISLDNSLNNHNLVVTKYLEVLMASYNEAFPLVKLGKKICDYAPWLSFKLKLCIRKKSKLYRLYMSGKISKITYTSFRNQLTAVLRRAKRLHYVKLFYSAGFAPKQIWSVIDNIINRKRGHTLRELKINGNVLTGLPLVNYINNYFVSVVLNLTRDLTPTAVYPFLSPQVPNSCFFYPATPTEVGRVIENLKNKGSKLHDIPPMLIKENKDIFSNHITMCYNSSLNESIYPDVLKIGRVSPVYKSGPEEQVDNYRPISSLSSFSKIYESLTLHRMMSFISAFSILTPAQYGFRQGRSTTQAVIRLLSFITEAYHRKDFCVCFFLDLRKAFDSINHVILFKKLFHYGFRGAAHEFLKSYFTNRKQFVCLDDFKSRMENIVCGVPQGSILGPLCFNIFINDLPLAVSEKCVLFADDAAFVITSPNIADIYQRIEKLLADITDYLKYNCLIPNVSKSKLMFFSSRRVTELPVFRFSGGTVDWVSEFKYLGLTLTNKLSYGMHISKVALNVSRISGMIASVREFVPRYVLLKLYQALALPHINFHLEIWGSAPTYQLNILEVKINNLLRTIFGIYRLNGRPTMGAQEMYSTYGMLKLGSLHKLKLFKLLHALLDGRIPQLHEILLNPYYNHHNYATRGNIFRHPSLTCEIERRFLSHQLITLHEQLPSDLFESSLSSSLRFLNQRLLDTQ